MKLAERLDGLVVGAADAGFVAGDSVDFVGEGELVADLERAREGVILEASDAEEAPPVMSEELDLLRFGFGLRAPLVLQVREELVEGGGGFGG